MKRLIPNRACVIMVVLMFAAQVLLAPASANAAYRDRSDELPGDDSSTGTLIIAAVAVGIVVGYMVYKHSKKDDGKKEEADDEEKTEQETPDDQEGQGQSAILLPSYPTERSIGANLAGENKLNPGVKGASLGLYFDITDDSKLYGMREAAPDFSDLTVKVGLSIGF